MSQQQPWVWNFWCMRWSYLHGDTHTHARAHSCLPLLCQHAGRISHVHYTNQNTYLKQNLNKLNKWGQKTKWRMKTRFKNCLGMVRTGWLENLHLLHCAEKEVLDLVRCSCQCIIFAVFKRKQSLLWLEGLNAPMSPSSNVRRWIVFR